MIFGMIKWCCTIDLPHQAKGDQTKVERDRLGPWTGNMRVEREENEICLHPRVFQKKLFIEFVHGVKSEHGYWQYRDNRKKIGTLSAFPLECRTIL